MEGKNQKFFTKALEKLKQCKVSLKVYFNELKTKKKLMTCIEPKNITENDRDKLDSKIYSPHLIIGRINYSAMKFNILTDVLGGY
ncbi:hypothetical protein EWB00_010542 [Schistosoma japonicum]|uniref:Uncharacterized protein n=1 Tax=Schistosoma japonicum TaxID=6182 RepID=A0A4Z2CKV7_SCHJA|nr:hypothetical protein EWB00_010542 [Schistosoma japonicum]